MLTKSKVVYFKLFTGKAGGYVIGNSVWQNKKSSLSCKESYVILLKFKYAEFQFEPKNVVSHTIFMGKGQNSFSSDQCMAWQSPDQWQNDIRH
jgi:hypothetical protein